MDQLTKYYKAIYFKQISYLPSGYPLPKLERPGKSVDAGQWDAHPDWTLNLPPGWMQIILVHRLAPLPHPQGQYSEYSRMPWRVLHNCRSKQLGL